MGSLSMMPPWGQCDTNLSPPLPLQYPTPPLTHLPYTIGEQRSAVSPPPPPPPIPSPIQSVLSHGQPLYDVLLPESGPRVPVDLSNGNKPWSGGEVGQARSGSF